MTKWLFILERKVVPFLVFLNLWSPIFVSYVINLLSHLCSCNMPYFPRFSYFCISFHLRKGINDKNMKNPLREKCPNTGFFLVRVFPHSDWIRRDSISLYSVGMRRNTDQKKLRIWTLFTQWPCDNLYLMYFWASYFRGNFFPDFFIMNNHYYHFFIFSYLLTPSESVSSF